MLCYCGMMWDACFIVVRYASMLWYDMLCYSLLCYCGKGYAFICHSIYIGIVCYPGIVCYGIVCSPIILRNAMHDLVCYDIVYITIHINTLTLSYSDVVKLPPASWLWRNMQT